MIHCRTAAVGNYHALKRVSFSQCLLLLTLLVTLLLTSAVDEIVARPSADDMYAKLVGADEYADVDNVEWHHVKIVDGLIEEDHPIIMYKEDFVSEDFDPSKNRSSEAVNRHAPRKYKSIAQRRRNRLRHNNDESSSPVTEKYRALKPRKMLFDVLPKTPLTSDDSSVPIDPKFDPSKIRVEVISLTDDNYNNFNNNNNDEPIEIVGGDEPSKQLLNKRPKKYHRRMRRNAPADDAAAEDHVRDKRNPYYRQNYQTVFSSGSGGNWVLVPVSTQQQNGNKHTTSGKFWNALYYEVPAFPVTPTRGPRPRPTQRQNATNTDGGTMQFGPRFGSDNEKDVVVWGGGSSGGSGGSSNSNTNVNTNINEVTDRPQRRRRPQQSIFHNSNPEDADISFATRQPPSAQQPASPSAPRPPPSSSSRVDGSASNPTAAFAPPVTTTRRPATMRPTSRPATDVAVTNCMWAIVNCCSTRDLELRYGCFEQYNCSGVFWDLNPCADPLRDDLVNFVSDFYD